MEASFDQLQNIQRIKYEAFANFATEINKATSYQAIAASLSGRIKFILDSFIFRIYYQFEKTALSFEVFRGNCTFEQMPETAILEFEKQVLQREIPLTVPTAEIQENPHLNSTVFNHPKVYGLSILPSSGDQYQIIVTNAFRKEDSFLEHDFKFLRLISDLMASKLSQLFLIHQVEEKRIELEYKNKQITLLNQTLEEKVAHRTAELKETNQELQTLFYRTSHDFKAPLSNILGLINLAEILGNDDEVLNLLSKCKSVVNGLNKMLSKLNTLSSFEFEKNFEPINFANIIQEMKHHFHKTITAKNVVIRFEDVLTKQFFCHKAMIYFILENLFENAVCFSKKTPVIDIKISSAAPNILIHFTDNGFGISPEIINKIFDMYYRGNELSTGSGLGLYIVKKLVKTLGGSIHLKTEPEFFTTFTISLPFCDC